MHHSSRRLLALAGVTALASAGLVAGAVPASAATTLPTDLLRQLVVEQESTVPVRQGSSCSLQGAWVSSYDGATTTNIADFEVDHAVAGRPSVKPASPSGFHPARLPPRRRQRAHHRDMPTPEEFALAWARSCYAESRLDGRRALDALLDQRLDADDA